MGYRDNETFLSDEFAAVCDRVVIATEDGSAGTRGTVLDAIREQLSGAVDTGDGSGRPAVVFACGPGPMLRALKDWAEKQQADCWISLEERMACGIGACLACVCRTKETDTHSRVKNRRICKDGPVFRAEEIDL